MDTTDRKQRFLDQFSPDQKRVLAAASLTGLSLGAAVLAFAPRFVPPSATDTAPSSSEEKTSSFAWEKLSANDQEVINWSIKQLRKADQQEKFKVYTDQEFRTHYAMTEELLLSARAFYDLAMEAEAEQKSGRDFSVENSPQVSLKWDALTPFQQAAVEYEASQDKSPESKDTKIERLLQNPSHLQDMIDRYRASMELKLDKKGQRSK